jgi:hypothetical protein
MKILIFLISVISLHSYSQVEIQVVDPTLDTKALEGQGYKISKKTASHNALPDKNLRDSLLSDIPETKKWDELQKDIFYMELKKKSLNDLEKKYPQISKKQLEVLKDKRE